MKDNLSPEEKLLRLIKGQKQAGTVTEKKSSVLPVLKPDLKPEFKVLAYPLIRKYLSFLSLKKIISIVFIMSFIYLIISFSYSWTGLRKVKLPKVTPVKVIEPKTLPEEIKPYEFYLEGVKNRQIFSGALTQEPQGPAGVKVDLMKDISLVGIISGENPQAVIEDKKAQKTYYITKGQFIGEFQVQDIQEGKVILSYGGQRYELYL